METNHYRVRIVKGEEEFEAEGDKQFVLEMLQRYAHMPPGKATPGWKGEKRPPTSPSDKPISVGEFARQLGFKKHTDLVLSFAYYLEKYAETPEFTPGDINNLYYEAKLDSSNTSQMIIQNIRRGFMMEAKSQGPKAKRSYTVTQSGEEFIEKKLAGQPK